MDLLTPSKTSESLPENTRLDFIATAASEDSLFPSLKIKVSRLSSTSDAKVIPDEIVSKLDVTSISVDPHKYGLAPKGVSVALFRNNKLRNGAIFSSSEWLGGIYATPTHAGSRGGAASVGAWVAIMYNGYEGYKEKARAIIEGTKKAAAELRNNKHIQIVGEPCVSVYQTHIIRSLEPLVSFLILLIALILLIICQRKAGTLPPSNTHQVCTSPSLVSIFLSWMNL
jgi:hypothetical protein